MIVKIIDLSFGLFVSYAFLFSLLFCYTIDTFGDETRSTTVVNSTKSNDNTTLTPQKDLDSAMFDKAAKLESDFKSGKLSDDQERIYKKLLSDAESKQNAALDPKSIDSYASSDTTKSCKCTAYCQTIVWASNAGSYEWSATGTVSGPSACADAAVATCGGAYATFLLGWTCENIE